MKVKVIHKNELNAFTGDLRKVEDIFNKFLDSIEGKIKHIEKDNEVFVIFYEPNKEDLGKKLII